MEEGIFSFGKKMNGIKNTGMATIHNTSPANKILLMFLLTLMILALF
jgi:hypothetical protein